jgi:hypothetical protein
MVRVDREDVTYWIQNVHGMQVLVPVGQLGRDSDGKYIVEDGSTLSIIFSRVALSKAEFRDKYIDEHNGELYGKEYTPPNYKAERQRHFDKTGSRDTRTHLQPLDCGRGKMKWGTYRCGYGVTCKTCESVKMTMQAS